MEKDNGKEYTGTAPRIQARVDSKYKYFVDRFLDMKGLTQADIIRDYLPAVLIAVDEDLYWKLYKEVYGNATIDEQIKKKEG